MEDGLVLIYVVIEDYCHYCLNPYCNGRWSRTYMSSRYITCNTYVLILIVMEDGLVLDLIRLF